MMEHRIPVADDQHQIYYNDNNVKRVRVPVEACRHLLLMAPLTACLDLSAKFAPELRNHS
jgi:hypothetical protein